MQEVPINIAKHTAQHGSGIESQLRNTAISMGRHPWLFEEQDPFLENIIKIPLRQNLSMIVFGVLHKCLSS